MYPVPREAIFTPSPPGIIRRTPSKSFFPSLSSHLFYGFTPPCKSGQAGLPRDGAVWLNHSSSLSVSLSLLQSLLRETERTYPGTQVDKV